MEEAHPELVIAKGYGLSTGLVGQPNRFGLDARRAGLGDFDVVINGSSRALIEYVEEEEALYKIKYMVSLPGDYFIDIKFNNKHIPGSPFCTKIMDPSTVDEMVTKLEVHPNSSSLDSFSTLIDSSEDERTDSLKKLSVEAVVCSPSGKTLNGIVFRKANGKMSVKFPREEVGTYIVSMKNKTSGKVLKGSPYMVTVNPKKTQHVVTARGEGLRTAYLNEAGYIILNGLNDINDLCIAVVGPYTLNINVTQSISDSADVMYVAKRAGIYHFHIHDKGLPIPGSPFEITTSGYKTDEKFDFSSKAPIQSTMRVTIWYGRGTRSEKLTSKLRSSTGHNLPHSVSRRGRYVLDTTFLPFKNDVYELNFYFGNDSLLEQIFSIAIEHLPEGKELFSVTGEGIYHGVIGKPSIVCVDSLLPICKSFSVDFDGPDEVDISQSQSQDERLYITYVTRRYGQYIMTLKYDGFHIPGSPFQIIVKDPNLSGELQNLIVSYDSNATNSEPLLCRAFGKGLHEAVAGCTTGFTVDVVNAGNGTLMAGFIDQKSVASEVICKYLGECVYKVEYKIHEPGTYNLSVLWDHSHIDGSPFRILVTKEMK